MGDGMGGGAKAKRPDGGPSRRLWGFIVVYEVLQAFIGHYRRLWGVTGGCWDLEGFYVELLYTDLCRE